MSTIAEIELPADEFVLGATLSVVPDVAFEVVRVAAHSKDQIVPYVRVWNDDHEEMTVDVTDVMEDDPSVQEVELLDELGDERLYRMNWIYDAEFITHVLLEEEATIMEMVGQGDCWYLRILFPSRDSLGQTHDFCDEEGLTLDIIRITELSESVGRGEYGLSEAQYEALVTAVEKGYFDIPREVTMGELADELGISQQSLSERLRRAHRALINSALRTEATSIRGADGKTTSGDS